MMMSIATVSTYGAGWHRGWFWPLFPILWIALVWGLVIVGRRYLWRHDHDTLGRASGEAVLAERYARGEISEEDYRRRLAVLRERSR